MSAELAKTAYPVPSLPLVPWRDPQTASPAELSAYIEQLEQACRAYPHSADLRTCLGLAYAVNYDVYKSLDALEAATAIDPFHFWGQFKYAELHFRLRALERAEQETRKALELARNPWHLSLARKQLQDIRTLARNSARNVAWTKPLTAPSLVLAAMLLLLFLAMTWK